MQRKAREERGKLRDTRVYDRMPIVAAADGKALSARAEEIAPGYLEEVERLCAAADGYAGGNRS